jgi:hypothetical protein
MMRQITVSIPPEAPDETQEADLGNWRAQDLRAKGPSQPPRSSSSPPSEREQAELVDWLTRDLRLKHSLPPLRASAPPASSTSVAPASGGVASGGALRPPAATNAVVSQRPSPTEAGSVLRARIALVVAVALLLLAVAAFARRGGGSAAGTGSPAGTGSEPAPRALPPGASP